LIDAMAISALTIAVKLASAAKVIISGQFFGAGDALDAYLIAFLIPSFLGDICAGALNPALIPALLEMRQRKGSSAAISVYAGVLYQSLALFSIAALLLLAFANPVLRILASGFSPAKLALSRSLLGYMIAILPLSALSVIWRSVLNANQRFAAAAIAPMMTPLVTIAAVLAAGRFIGVSALALGTTVGAVAELTVLAIWLRSLNIPAFPRWNWKNAPSSGVFREYCPIVANNVVLGGSAMLDQTMAAMLGSGSVSFLNFGTRLPGVLLAVGPAALGTAIFPRLSAMSARREWGSLRRMLTTYLCLSAAVTVPAAIGLAFFSLPIARIVFQRGAFTAADTRVVAAVQAFSLLQLPMSVMLALLIRTIASLRANNLLLRTSAVALVANGVLNYVLMRWMGVAGIALSTTLVQVLLLALVGTIVFRRIRTMVQIDEQHAGNLGLDGN
jgi:putative peptidoglycan lipid II flippase